jgi:hypothetical protein
MRRTPIATGDRGAIGLGVSGAAVKMAPKGEVSPSKTAAGAQRQAAAPAKAKAPPPSGRSTTAAGKSRVAAGSLPTSTPTKATASAAGKSQEAAAMGSNTVSPNPSSATDPIGGAATATVPPPAAIATPPPETGKAVLRYNHYRHEFTIVVPPGDVNVAEIDDTFSFSYGFKGWVNSTAGRQMRGCLCYDNGLGATGTMKSTSLARGQTGRGCRGAIHTFPGWASAKSTFASSTKTPKSSRRTARSLACEYCFVFLCFPGCVVSKHNNPGP